MDRLGYDGVAFNEHHTSPYGLMNSPNLLASAVSQRTKSLKILIYGNLAPLHDPLRLAEELAMVDCLSNGRLISGFARGIPREYNVYNVPLTESRVSRRLTHSTGNGSFVAHAWPSRLSSSAYEDELRYSIVVSSPRLLR